MYHSPAVQSPLACPGELVGAEGLAWRAQGGGLRRVAGGGAGQGEAVLQAALLGLLQQPASIGVT